MSYFKLLNKRIVTDALVDAQTYLKRSERMPEFRELAQTTYDEFVREGRITTEVPALNLLVDESTLYKFIVKPRASAMDILYAYDALYATKLGVDENPGKVLEYVYSASSNGRRGLNRLCTPGDWLSVAMLLIGIAKSMGAESLKSAPDGASVLFGLRMLDASPEGLMNRQGFIVKNAGEPPNDSATYFPAIGCKDPVVRALLRMLEHEGPLWAVTIIAHGLHEGIVQESDLRKHFRLVLDRRRKSGPGRAPVVIKHLPAAGIAVDPRLVKATALRACAELLGSPSETLIADLYQAAVPKLISKREFCSSIANPSEDQTGRRVRPDTRERWMDLLRRAARVGYANA